MVRRPWLLETCNWYRALIPANLNESIHLFVRSRLFRQFNLMTTDGTSAATPPRPAMTDSPWFWAYLFGTAALIALFFAGNKFGPRQAQIEREFQARTRATQVLNGQEPTLKLSTPENTLVTLQPLWFVIAVITIAGWFLFWRSHRKAAAAPPTSSPSSAHHVDSGQPV